MGVRAIRSVMPSRSAEDRVVVGAYSADAGGLDAGSAYLFDTTGSRLAIFGRTEQFIGRCDYFGASVGVDERQGHDWSATRSGRCSEEPSRLTCDDLAASDPPLKNYARLTEQRAISTDTRSPISRRSSRYVESRHATDCETDTGAAYLFDFATGDQLAELLRYDGVSSDFFGRSVAISGNRAIVGAHGSDGTVTNRSSRRGASLLDLFTSRRLAKRSLRVTPQRSTVSALR